VETTGPDPYGHQMSRALYLSCPPSRRRADLNGPGLVIAAAILALFIFDVAHAASPATAVRLAVVESPTSQAALDVVLSVEADSAPTFQVFRGTAPGSWIVELPGVDLDGVTLGRRGPGVLLGATSVEPGIKGGTGRIVLSMHDDDVDFDATTKKKALQITFHHQGDKAALVAAHAARVVEQERIAKLALAKGAADAELARRAEQERLTKEKLATEQARLAAATKQQEQEREQIRLAAVRAEAERARLVAQQKADEDAAFKARALATQKKLDDDKARAALAQKQRDEDAAREKARLAALELQKQEAQKAEAEKARLAALEQKKIDDEKQRVAAVAAAQEKARLAALEQQKIDEAAKQRAAEVAAEKARLAAIEQQRVQEAAAAERARLAAVELQKKQDADKAAAALAEKTRLAALEQKKIEQQKLEQKKIDDAREQQRAVEQERARLAAIDTNTKLAAEKARLAAIEQKRIDDAIEQQRAADAAALAERARLAAVEQQRAKDAEQARLAEQERRRQDAARPAVDDAGFGGKPVIAAPTPTAPTARPLPTSLRPKPAPVGDSFGGLEGGRTVELSRGGNRYERVNLPEAKSDEWGGDDDDDSNDIDEGEGRSVLSQVTVQRSAGGARVGVRVDGGARYHVARRGRDRLVLTLVDTRADNLDVRRVLDARDLGGAVLRVMPTVEEDRRFRIELVVETRGSAPVRIEQDGQMLWLEVLG